MFTFRDGLIFLAGAAFFHAISHIMLALSGMLPINVGGMEFTAGMNMMGIVINGLIVLGMLYWASRLPK